MCKKFKMCKFLKSGVQERAKHACIIYNLKKKYFWEKEEHCHPLVDLNLKQILSIWKYELNRPLNRATTQLYVHNDAALHRGKAVFGVFIQSRFKNQVEKKLMAVVQHR